MKYTNRIPPKEITAFREILNDFIPEKIFDIHSHLYDSSHFPNGEWGFLEELDKLGLKENQDRLLEYMPAKSIHGLYFGMPRLSGNRFMINEFIRKEIENNGSDKNKGLIIAAPTDDPVAICSSLDSSPFCGIKVYHCFADRPDTMNASITEYAPEWMWEILQQTEGVLMLHIVREKGIADEENLTELRRLSKSYPRVKIILAHVARSFNYRTALRGLDSISDLDNIVVDTSAICETETFGAAMKALGPRRIHWGSDFPVSEMKGRCVTTGDHFFWLHPENIKSDYSAPTDTQMTLVGIESLWSLKESCENNGLTRTDIEDIFYNNALRLLSKFEVGETNTTNVSGPELWSEACNHIANGTALMSKRAEMFGKNTWPAYYSRSQGCEVWDLEGRRYIDFVGGVGSVLLGYADPEVNAAVQRRVMMGSYSSLVNPDEVMLAKKLLKMHPWAEGGKVRFARTGGEAMSIAIRCARSSSGKSGIAFCGYHGWHDWYLAANLGESSALDGHLIPGLSPVGVPRELLNTSVPFRYNDLHSFDHAISKLDSNLAAVVMEPMRSQYPDPEFINHVVGTCRKKGIVLIVDEITSGLRYGFPGIHLHINLQPDIVVYAKAMSNGIPFGAVIGQKNVMERSEKSFISSSYWTDGIGTSAALAVLEKAERIHLYENVWEKGLYFQRQLSEVASGFSHLKVEISGMPPTPSLTFGPQEHSGALKSFYIHKMLHRGFLASTFFYLMESHTMNHLEKFIQAFGSVLDEMDDIIKKGDLEKFRILKDDTKDGFTRLA